MTTKQKEIALIIAKIVCDYYGITLKEMCMKTGYEQVRYPRQIAQTAIYHHFQCEVRRSTSNAARSVSLKDVGFILGRKDHATVSNSKRQLQALIQTDPQVRKEWNDIQDRITMVFSSDEIKVKLLIGQLSRVVVPDGNVISHKMQYVRIELYKLIKYLEEESMFLPNKMMAL